MTSTEVQPYKPYHLAEIHTLATQQERYKAFMHAMTPMEHPKCKRPVPLFMGGMPWAGEDDETQERIIAQMLASDDPLGETEAGETLSGSDLVGRRIVVHDVRCAPSTYQSGWGAYLICDVTVDDEIDHKIMTVGAKEAVAKLAYAHYAGQLPVTGTMTVVTQTAEGNTVLGFVVEPAL